MLAKENIQIKAINVLDEKFKSVAHHLCSILANEGIRCRGYLPELPLFSSISDEHKKIAIEKLQFYIELCLEQTAEGYSLKDSSTFTWRALRRMGYVPTSDLFAHIKDDHVIEIYSKDAVQVFRNLNFFQFCSYTLEEILCLEWWNLFSRPNEMSTRIHEATMKIFADGCRDNINPNVPPHIVTETESLDRLTMEFSMDLMSPLFVNRIPEAIICLERARLIGKADNSHRKQKNSER